MATKNLYFDGVTIRSCEHSKFVERVQKLVDAITERIDKEGECDVIWSADLHAWYFDGGWNDANHKEYTKEHRINSAGFEFMLDCFSRAGYYLTTRRGYDASGSSLFSIEALIEGDEPKHEYDITITSNRQTTIKVEAKSEEEAIEKARARHACDWQDGEIEESLNENEEVTFKNNNNE